jgi:hypothetical protein
MNKPSWRQKTWQRAICPDVISANVLSAKVISGNFISDDIIFASIISVGSYLSFMMTSFLSKLFLRHQCCSRTNVMWHKCRRDKCRQRDAISAPIWRTGKEGIISRNLSQILIVLPFPFPSLASVSRVAQCQKAFLVTFQTLSNFRNIKLIIWKRWRKVKMSISKLLIMVSSPLVSSP